MIPVAQACVRERTFLPLKLRPLTLALGIIGLTTAPCEAFSANGDRATAGQLWLAQGLESRSPPPRLWGETSGGDEAFVQLTPEEDRWLRAAWAYFNGAPAPQAPPPQAPPPPQAQPAPPPVQQQPSPPQPVQQQWSGNPGGGFVPSPSDPRLLVEVRAGTNVATPWSIADQLAALLIAHRMGLIDARTFDRRATRLVDFLNWMTLTPDRMPNRFYNVDSGTALGGDLQPGIAGWSAVETGRLLLWLRIAAEEHPKFAPFIRNAVARLSVCRIISDRSQLQIATAGPDGLQTAPETGRGYDAYGAQGYRAWGMEVPVPEVQDVYPYETEILGLRFPLTEDVDNQAPLMTTPPAYLGLELGFATLGDRVDEVAGGRAADDLMAALAEVQARAYAQTGRPMGRSDFRRGEDPTTIFATALAQGYPWSVIAPDGSLRPSLALVSTRAAFALNTFADDANAALLLSLVEELYDPGTGWYEGRYETTGAYEMTRTSATNAFVMATVAYRNLGPLFPDTARPTDLQPVTQGSDGRCILPLANPSPPF
ncbi:DUF3131 domain-containing protein [Halodurantibacterium flavum]|uniref:DUF3131 domain-containing protein n=1 Tax=Halodurantibacterium flavum TaxID=1382802 RepID=A0ABW4S5L5_9RHOB